MHLSDLSVGHIRKRIKTRGVEGYLAGFTCTNSRADDKGYPKASLYIYLEEYDSFSEKLQVNVEQWHEIEVFND